MVYIDVQDGCTLSSTCQHFRCNGRIVEIAKACGNIGRCMMARRPAERIDKPFSAENKVCTMCRCGRTGAGGLPCCSHYWAGAVAEMIAALPRDAVRIAGIRQIVTAEGEDIGNRAFACIRLPFPAFENRTQ